MQVSENSVATERLVFRYGRDMAPETIAAETPGARFVARARLVEDRTPGIAVPAGVSGAVWGILLIQPEPPGRQVDADVVTDEGRVTHATILTDADALEDIEAVVTQARYWELAPTYIAGLDRRRETA